MSVIKGILEIIDEELKNLNEYRDFTALTNFKNMMSGEATEKDVLEYIKVKRTRFAITILERIRLKIVNQENEVISFGDLPETI